MRRPNSTRIAAVVAAALFCATAGQIPNACAQANPIREPDRFAWELFARVSRPTSDRSLPWPAGTVEWETRALASRVYADPNNAPDWDRSRSPASMPTHRFESLPLQQFALLQDAQIRHRGEPLVDLLRKSPQFVAPTNDEGDEVRINRPAFDFVVANEFYSVEGQEAFAGHGKTIAFPESAVEVKAVWKVIDPADRDRYHVIELGTSQDQQLWGLIAIHLTTKDLPNWFWATWEHEDNPQRESVVRSRDHFGAVVDKDGLWIGPSDALKDLLVAETLATRVNDGSYSPSKWHHYVLRGTQTDFTSPTGRPTILANSIIEEGFQDSSSCITCHAKATIGPKLRRSDEINRLPIFASQSPVRGDIGLPAQEWFGNDNTAPPSVRYQQTDFVWSMFRAKRRHRSTAQDTSFRADQGNATVAAAHADVSTSRLTGVWRYRSFRNDPQVRLNGISTSVSAINLQSWLSSVTHTLTERADGPGYVFGEANLNFADGTIGDVDWSLRLKDVLTTSVTLPSTHSIPLPFASPAVVVVQFDAVGESGSDFEDFHYRYFGFLVPNWTDGVDQQPAIIGSVMRVKARPNRPAGVVASWIAVQKND